MKKKVFIILGYGIPKNIMKDQNYNIYLRIVFNMIFDQAALEKIDAPELIFCGGKTDMFPPYRRTEAEEMIRFFKSLANRSFVKNLTTDWTLKAEKKSFSTLENLLFASTMIQHEDYGTVTVFCEKTREKRIKYTAKKVFPSWQVKVIPIDFDNRLNRYKNPELLAQKEQKAIEMIDSILKSPEALKKHRRDFIKKFHLLRNTDPKRRAAVLRQWWEKHIS